MLRKLLGSAQKGKQQICRASHEQKLVLVVLHVRHCGVRPTIATFALLVFLAAAAGASPAVTADELTGTYRAGASEIKILALDAEKLKVQFALVYEHDSPAGPTANTGEASGEVTIDGNIAEFVPDESGDCTITMTFLPKGRLKVEQEGNECGFGHNVRADGTFRKVSNRKPKFDDA
jgi:hypothetical protein